MDPNQIAWIPLGAGVTVVGVLLSWVAWRRRGSASGLRGLAWSLIPLAATLTGVTAMLWQAGAVVGRWLTGFVFNPTAWAGVIVFGMAAVLYVASGLLRRRGKGGRAARREPAGATAKTAKSDDTSKPSKPAAPEKPEPRQQLERRKPEAADPDMAEIDEILKRRGIS
jgi:hypothetical protein